MHLPIQTMWKEMMGDRMDRSNNTFAANPNLGISFPEFETWWKKKEGIDDPDIPVVPEYMTNKIAEMTALLKNQVGEDPLHSRPF